MASIKRFLENKLRLRINEKKSKVVPVEECGFLGFVFVNGKIRWSEKSFLDLNGGYVCLPEGAGLYPWSTGTRS